MVRGVVRGEDEGVIVPARAGAALALSPCLYEPLHTAGTAWRHGNQHPLPPPAYAAQAGRALGHCPTTPAHNDGRA